jgi:hypothetical protein
MRKLLLSTLILFITLSAFAQGGIPLKTGQKYVTAIVDHGSGWVQVKIFPGNNSNGTLSFYQKSFVSFNVNGKVYTNNDVGLSSPLPANTFIMKDGVLSKIAGKSANTDTIRCVWPNKDGVDLIQEVYPVLFDHSEQIVFRWKVLNKLASPVIVAVQYLLDVQVGDQAYTNDGAPLLTRYGYRPNWETITPGYKDGIPPYYIAFQYPLPHPPTFDPGLSGMGYTDNSYANLGLTKPIRQTIGNWPDMIQVRWGPPTPLPNGQYTDCATLLEFNSATGQSNKESLIAATSYGTGAFAMCKGQLFGLLFYPPRINWEPPNLVPNPFTVEMHLFNPQGGGLIPQNTKLTLRVGDSLTILAPDTIKNNGKTQTQIIPPFTGVGVATWSVQAAKSKECTKDLISSLKFQAENSSLGYPIFIDSLPSNDTCEHPIIIECANDDQFPPIVEPIVVYQNGDKSIGAHDDRPVTDKGLKSISWKPQAGTDSSNFLFTITPAISGCSKDTHYVQIHQLDSTKGGCFDLVFEDCAGNISDTTVCLEIHIPPPEPDIVAPKLFDDSVLSTRMAYFTVSDTSSLDSGIKQIVITPAVYGTVFDTIIPGLTPCSKLVHQVTLTRTDSLHDECIKVTITDCAGNITLDSICFKRDTTLAVKNTADEAAFQILGNPSSGRATIQLALEKSQDVTLRIVDALGREVRRVDVKGLSQGENLIPLQTSELASGTYYVVAEIDDKQFMKTLKVVR